MLIRKLFKEINVFLIYIANILIFCFSMKSIVYFCYEK